MSFGLPSENAADAQTENTSSCSFGGFWEVSMQNPRSWVSINGD